MRDVTLSPEARGVTVSLPPDGPRGDAALELKVNPDELHPANETNYRDNAAEVLSEVKEPLDIALAMLYAQELWTRMALKVWVETWVAHCPGARTDVVLTVNGRSARSGSRCPRASPVRW